MSEHDVEHLISVFPEKESVDCFERKGVKNVSNHLCSITPCKKDNQVVGEGLW